MKRPLCMLCLIYVGFVLLFYALFPPGNPEREGEGQRIRVTGSIVGLEEKNQKSRIYLKENPGRAGLICYLDDPSIIYSFKIGQTISVAGTRRFFEKATNEGQFDANLYYSILECDYFMTGCGITLVEGSYNHFAQFIFVLHHKLSGIIAQGLPSQEAGILQAMLLGEKGNLDPDIRNLFSRNGIAHILAISGVKTLCLVSPISRTSGLKWGFLRLHNAKKYIQNLCFKGQFHARCPPRFCGG